MKKNIVTVQERKGNYEKLPSGNYRFTYSYKGIRYRDTFDDVESDFDAEIRLRQYVNDIESGEYENQNYTVSKWAQTWIDKTVKPNSSGDRTPNKYIGFLNKRFLPFFGTKKLKDITVENMVDYFNWLKSQKTDYENKQNRPLAPATLEKFHSIVHAMFESAVFWKKIPYNPCPPKRKFNFKVNVDGTKKTTGQNNINDKIENDINYFSKKDYDRALKLLEQQENDIILNERLSDKEKHFKYGRLLAYELDFKTGMRRSELYALTKEDFDFENATVRITKSRQNTKNNGEQILITKTKKSSRIISIPKSLIPKLMYFFNITPSFYTYIFEDLSIDGISSYWSEWQKQYDFNPIRFQDIRHTHASILFYMGVDIRVISQRLGHSTTKTTEEVYLFIILEIRQKLSNQIDCL